MYKWIEISLLNNLNGDQLIAIDNDANLDTEWNACFKVVEHYSNNALSIWLFVFSSSVHFKSRTINIYIYIYEVLKEG